jgi:hypothetical protein
MTPQPQQEDGIQTFAGCRDRWWEQEMSIVHNQSLYSCQRWYLDTGCSYLCDRLCEEGKCPRGFPK